ncbi:hypothetical protein EDD21DRAFT_358031 [Dissophora ornata]|nr:hypothetical protein EDD21DRAFT_358031 [Dissophora ornata]
MFAQNTIFRRPPIPILVCAAVHRVGNRWIGLLSYEAGTKSTYPGNRIKVASFMVAATTIFDEDLYLASQRNLSGRRGNGPVDFSVHSHKTQAWTLAVTMVKGEDFRRGVAQNMVQLESASMESALMEKKRKRETYDVDGVEQPPKEIKSYGIVTDASEWAVIECTIDEDEAVSYRMTKLPETLAFAGNWQQGASDVFQKLLWLWSEMLDESIRA